MSGRFVSCRVVLWCALLSGCPVPVDGQVDDAGEDVGDAGPEPERPSLSPACVDVPCAAGQVCVDLGALVIDTDEAPACFAVCDVVGASCTTVSDRAGACTALEGGELVCVATSVDLDGCGTRANAVCDDGAICAVFADLGGIRTCVSPCDPAAPTTCRGDVEGCGCVGDEVCTSFVALQSGDNICAPPAARGATCGVEDNGDISPCDTGSRCLLQGGLYPGRCE